MARKSFVMTPRLLWSRKHEATGAKILVQVLNPGFWVNWRPYASSDAYHTVAVISGGSDADKERALAQAADALALGPPDAINPKKHAAEDSAARTLSRAQGEATPSRLSYLQRAGRLAKLAAEGKTDSDEFRELTASLAKKAPRDGGGIAENPASASDAAAPAKATAAKSWPAAGTKHEAVNTELGEWARGPSTFLSLATPILPSHEWPPVYLEARPMPDGKFKVFACVSDGATPGVGMNKATPWLKDKTRDDALAALTVLASEGPEVWRHYAVNGTKENAA